MKSSKDLHSEHPVCFWMKKKEWKFIEEHREKHPAGVSQRRRFWGDLIGAFQYLKMVYKRDGEGLLNTFPTAAEKPPPTHILEVLMHSKAFSLSHTRKHNILIHFCFTLKNVIFHLENPEELISY